MQQVIICFMASFSDDTIYKYLRSLGRDLYNLIKNLENPKPTSNNIFHDFCRMPLFSYAIQRYADEQE